LGSEWDEISELNSEDFFEATDPDSDDVPELQPVSDSSDEEDMIEDQKSDDDDLPGLDPVSDSDEEDLREGTLEEVLEKLRKSSANDEQKSHDPLVQRVQQVLTQCGPFPGDGEPVDPTYRPGQPRFLIERQPRGFICIYDRIQGFETDIHKAGMTLVLLPHPSLKFPRTKALRI
jgi:hypothetical protein